MTNDEIKQYYHGAYRFSETDDGYLYGIQHTEEQLAHLRTKRAEDFFYLRGYYGNAKTLEFITDATEISLELRCRNGGRETVELAVDGIIQEVHMAGDINEKGKLTFKLKEGTKNVVIYLTADNVTYIRNLEMNAPAKPVKKDTKVLWMGDSITQGYGTFRSGETYVSVANRILGYEVLNQGVGGYYYDKGILTEMKGYTPDKIIIAHGTNQFFTETCVQDTVEYYERLAELYPNIPVLTITPLWRGTFRDELLTGENLEKFVSFCKKIGEIAGSYPNIKVLDGFKLMHNSIEYYMPDWLHPNALGGEVFGRNLAAEIKRINF
ncbi:MAG: SGNH/GDSL hydrolase family protein [Clostridia bacterium]|nr:SGNH/GDSL hydrolase family protein [Clostridia bacterium]